MFHQTLGGATRNWFNDLDPKSVDSFEELSQKFLEEFSQQKRYAKDPTEIYGIKRRYKEGLQAFMDRLKFKSSHIKGVPPVLRISAFMHGHGHLELAKKLNDKIPKTVDEMSKESEPSLEEKWSRGQQNWEGGNRKRPFEKERSGITDELTFPAIPQNQLTDEPIILEGVFEGNQVRRILVDGGISSSQDLEDAELR
ncbi:reverse transcriptase domain-containing protein [Tanacetum coccineum]